MNSLLEIVDLYGNVLDTAWPLLLNALQVSPCLLSHNRLSHAFMLIFIQYLPCSKTNVGLVCACDDVLFATSATYMIVQHANSIFFYS